MRFSARRAKIDRGGLRDDRICRIELTAMKKPARMTEAGSNTGSANGDETAIRPLPDQAFAQLSFCRVLRLEELLAVVHGRLDRSLTFLPVGRANFAVLLEEL